MTTDNATHTKRYTHTSKHNKATQTKHNNTPPHTTHQTGCQNGSSDPEKRVQLVFVQLLHTPEGWFDVDDLQGRTYTSCHIILTSVKINTLNRHCTEIYESIPPTTSIQMSIDYTTDCRWGQKQALPYTSFVHTNDQRSHRGQQQRGAWPCGNTQCSPSWRGWRYICW